MTNLTNSSWHAMSAQNAADALESDVSCGLSAAEAGTRLRKFGPNELATQQGKGPVLRFLLQFHQPLVYLLLAAGFTTLILAEWIDASVILSVVLINAVVGFVQEGRALQAIDALAKTVTTLATVLRDGEAHELPAAQLVPGDVVLLASGQKIPADLRLIQARDLEVDESTLTGESVPVSKQTAGLPEDTLLADRENCAYASTLVTHGQGRGLVTATGEQTEVGRISQLLQSAETLETPLTRRIAKFSHVLLYVILGLAVLTFLVGLARGMAAADIFLASVALAVGAIPEGLPAAVTIILAIGVSRMAKRQAIIRQLPAVETLGGATVICSDKTGTLTENQMTVLALFAGNERWTVEGTGYAPHGEINPKTESIALTELLRCGLFCNDSRIEEKTGGWVVEGDPTEGALITVARKSGLAGGEKHPRLDAIPFESEYQYMATLHQDGTVYLKGSLEAILPRCEDALQADGRRTPVEPESLVQTADDLASRGLRVLAFAKMKLPPGQSTLTHEDVKDRFTFLGFQAMIDPARPAAVEAVKACRKAGILVKMITGDHPRTAMAIAEKVGLPASKVISGRELTEFDAEEFVTAANEASVFARVTPEQKLRIVEALQRLGHIVAMTGDGVNDAPALKRADIGIAMGNKGTDVAREASAMVLTDDNFESIHAAVEEGRAVFENLKKFIVWTLPTNLGEGLIILAAIFAGVTLPILPVQILWINMATVAILGSALAFEPGESGLMQRRPRNPAEPILTRMLIFRVFFVAFLMLAGAFAFFQWQLQNGAGIDQARTAAVNVVVAIELAYVFNCRSLREPVWRVGFFSNRWMILAVFVMAGLQLIFTYAKPMNLLFHTAPLPAGSWLGIIGIAGAVFLLVSLEKWIVRLRERRFDQATPVSSMNDGQLG